MEIKEKIEKVYESGSGYLFVDEDKEILIEIYKALKKYGISNYAGITRILKVATNIATFITTI